MESIVNGQIVSIELSSISSISFCFSFFSFFFLSMCDVKKFLTFTFTEYGTVLTTILPILFLHLNTVIVTAGAFEP